jgi:uncharacterized protein (TIGR00730 family)
MSPLSQLKSLAIFCGSSMGSDPCYRQAVERLAGVLVEKQITIVYGGAAVGLMGVLADTALASGGKVIGVIPKLLFNIEIAHRGLSECHVVASMHERKAKIAELADGFIVLPGGAGTMDEFFEIYTWAQLHLHLKPCGILNINHYYDPVIKFLDQTVAQGFMNHQNRNMVFVESEIEKLLESFTAYIPSDLGKWITPKAEIL